MEISEMIEVLQRAIYADGKCVNVEIAESRGNNWRKNDFPLWNFAHHNYRIKPKPKRVPLTKEDLIERIKDNQTMWVKYKLFSTEYEQITGFDSVSIYFAFDEIDYESLSEFGIFLDGTPCSKEADYE